MKFLFIVIIASLDLFSFETHPSFSFCDKDSNVTYSSFMLDTLPKFIGGSDSLQKVIFNEITKPFMNIGFEGIVVFCFKIDRKGILSSVFISGETENNIFNKVVVKLKNKLQNWNAGKLCNKNVNSIICLPVIFKFR